MGTYGYESTEYFHEIDMKYPMREKQVSIAKLYVFRYTKFPV